jgi:hypothetical protein
MTKVAKTTVTRKRAVKLASNGKLPSRRNILRAPRSSWIAFLSSIRQEKREEYKDLSFGELCQRLSPIWSSMNVEEKRPFMEQYVLDKARYQRQLKDLSDDDSKVLRAHKRLRKKRRVGRPKAAMSSYMIYVADERSRVTSECPDITFQSIGQELGRRWRSLSDENRLKYTELAFTDRQRFDSELTVWKQQKNEEKLQQKIERDTKKQQKTQKDVVTN